MGKGAGPVQHTPWDRRTCCQPAPDPESDFPMFNLGPMELLVIVVVALVVLGPSRLPDAMRQVGKGLGEARRWSTQLTSEVQSAFVPEPAPVRSTAPAYGPAAAAYPAESYPAPSYPPPAYPAAGSTETFDATAPATTDGPVGATS